jgi:4-hydroxy-tetrahydrodipicolinate synthase
MITPLVDSQQIDLPGLERLVERILSAPVSGLFAVGTTGEGPSLSHDLRHQFVELVCDQVAGRVPVFVGISDTSFDESVELAGEAYAAGAAAVVATPPYYLPMSQPELMRYMFRLADVCYLPLVLYNMPSCTKVSFEAETVQRLSEHPIIIGLKDSSGDLDYFQRVAKRLKDRPHFSLLVGPEELLREAVRRGAHGGVNGGANLFPRLYVNLYQAAVAGQDDEAARLQELVMQISRTIYSVGKEPSRIIKGIKSALHCLGVCEDYVAEPFERFQDAERQQIDQHLQALLPALAEQAEVSQPSAA